MQLALGATQHPLAISGVSLGGKVDLELPEHG